MPLKRHVHFKRYRHIIMVLVRNGFGLLLEQLGVFGYLRMRRRPSDPTGEQASQNARLSVGERLRSACEELGPTFVKIGQILSTRPDIFSPEVAGELEKLQDAVSPFPFEDVKKVIEEEFGEPLNDIFEWIDYKPLASASLSQVHRALLPTGQPVVVKVQRPGIQEQIRVDLDIVKDLVSFIHNRTQYGQLYDYSGMVKELDKTLNNELDFAREGANADQFRKNFANRDKVKVPTVHWIYTTSRVLTMERVEGIRITDKEKLKAASIDPTELGVRLCQDLILQTLEDGFFHADPHPGNLFIQEDGTICYLDLGMVGQLSEARKKALSGLFLGIASQNSRQVVEALVDMDTVMKRGSIRQFEHEVDKLMDEYLSVPVTEIQVGQLIAELFQLAYHNHIQIPGELILNAKVMITLQGTLDKLDADVNLLVIMRPMAAKLLRGEFLLDELRQEVVRNVQNYKALLEHAPVMMLEMLYKLEEDDYNLRFELKDIERVQIHFDRIANRLSFSVILLAVALIIAGIIVGTSYSAGTDPSLAVVNMVVLRGSIVVAVLILIGLIVSIIRTKKF